ncbi:MAG: co-chaperone GroES [Aureliella sp.]|jgi:chaperonin GroES
MATATKSKDKTTVKLQPIGDRLVVKREESEGKTAGGIVLPDSAKDKPTRGTVVAVGDGRLLNDGKRGALQVKVGDRVLFTSYSGENIEIGDEEYVLMGESEVLAVLEG